MAFTFPNVWGENVEICFLSYYIRTSIRFLILPLGLQSQKNLLFGLLQENLLAPDLEL